MKNSSDKCAFCQQSPHNGCCLCRADNTTERKMAGLRELKLCSKCISKIKIAGFILEDGSGNVINQYCAICHQNIPKSAKPIGFPVLGSDLHFGPHYINTNVRD